MTNITFLLLLIPELVLLILFFRLSTRLSRQSKIIKSLKSKKVLIPDDHLESLKKEIQTYAESEITNSQVKVDELINSVLKLTEDVKTKLLSDVETLSKRYLAEETEILDRYALLMREDILAELKKQKANLSQIVIDKQAQIDTELSAYRQQELTNIKTKAQQIFSQVITDVISKNLTAKDQEELILSSLTKAQKEHVF